MLYDSYPDCEEQTNEINEPESNKLEDAQQEYKICQDLMKINKMS